MGEPAVTAGKRLLLLLSGGALCLATTAVAAQTRMYELLRAQPESEQQRILRTMINSTGNACLEVTGILFRGADREDTGYFTTSCADGSNWMVAVKNDAEGSSSVVACPILKTVGIDCWKPFEEDR